MKPEYMELPLIGDLCEVAIEEVLSRFEKAHKTYTLHVGKGVWHMAKRLHAAWNPGFNPFAPTLNIQLEPEFNNCEWCLAAEGETAIGSGGWV